MSRRQSEGAALPLVLWLIVLLTATFGAFAMASRVEMLQGRQQADGAQAREIARAGMEYALSRLLDPVPERRWLADGRRYKWRFADADVDIRIIDESGKVDLNQADPVLLTSLLAALGQNPAQAQRLAGAIVDWRDPDTLGQPSGGAEDADYTAVGLSHGAKDAPFESISELQQVLGMTPDVYAQLAPNLTLYSGMARPAADYAPGPVRRALGLEATPPWPNAAPGPLGGIGIYSIESRARLVSGREEVMGAVVRNDGGRVPGAVYTVLRWQQGTLAR